MIVPLGQQKYAYLETNHSAGNLLVQLSIFLLLGHISLIWYMFRVSLLVLLYRHIIWLFFVYFAIFMEPCLDLYASLWILLSRFELTQMLVGQIFRTLVILPLLFAFFLDSPLFLDVASMKTLLPNLILRLNIKQ